MRLLVVSDSHGNSQILDELISKYHEQVDAFVHCGDSELTSSNLVWSMMDTVAGNCDYDPAFPQTIVKRDYDYPYLMVHGHRHDVRWTLDQLASLAKQEQVKFVFYGHTHILDFAEQDGIYFINPGSIKSPRGTFYEKTYCIVEANQKNVKINVFNHQHNEIASLKKEWLLPN